MKDSKFGAGRTGLVALTALFLLALLAPTALAADPSGEITIEENPGAALDFVWVLMWLLLERLKKVKSELVEEQSMI